MIFSKQKLFCQICGLEMNISLANGAYHHRVCGKECWDEYSWRETLSIMGKEYYSKDVVERNKT